MHKKVHEILKIFFLSSIPAVFNFLLFQNIFKYSDIANYRPVISALGLFVFISSLHSQIVPTYNYVNRSVLSVFDREIIRSFFLLINFVFGLVSFIYYNEIVEGDFFVLLLIVLGAYLYSHILICIDYYFIHHNLQKKFLKGATLGFLLLASKVLSFVFCFIINDLKYFFILDAFVLLIFSISNGVSIFPVVKFLNVESILINLNKLNPIISRLLYFNLLPWIFYFTAIKFDSVVKTSFYLAERIVFSGIGLVVTPFIPFMLIAKNSDDYIFTRKTTIRFILLVLVYEVFLVLFVKTEFLLKNVASIIAIDFKILWLFLAITPLHIFISFFARPTLMISQKGSRYFYLAYFIFITGAFLFQLLENVYVFFTTTFIIQILLCVRYLKVLQRPSRDLRI